jgi:transcriptional regulator with XRE-family HTH domain
MASITETQWSLATSRILLVATVDPSEIGRRIKRAREQKGWTQLTFALEANVSPSTITRWESGKLPPVRELIRIAQLLDVDADYLVEDETPIAPRPVAVVDYADEILRRLEAGDAVAPALREELAVELERLSERSSRAAARLRRVSKVGE